MGQNIFGKNGKKFCLGIKKALHLHSLIERKTAMFGGRTGKKERQSSLKDIKKVRREDRLGSGYESWFSLRVNKGKIIYGKRSKA